MLETPSYPQQNVHRVLTDQNQALRGSLDINPVYRRAMVLKRPETDNNAEACLGFHHNDHLLDDDRVAHTQHAMALDL